MRLASALITGLDEGPLPVRTPERFRLTRVTAPEIRSNRNTSLPSLPSLRPSTRSVARLEKATYLPLALIAGCDEDALAALEGESLAWLTRVVVLAIRSNRNTSRSPLESA